MTQDELNEVRRGLPQGDQELGHKGLGHKGLGDWSQFAQQGWSLPNGDMLLPLATLDWAVLGRNLGWMQRFARDAGALLAPHAKTAMTPALMQAQLAEVAWGLTVATVAQLQSAWRAGAQRIILANPLVGRAEQHAVAALLQQGADIFVLIDDASMLAPLHHTMAEAAVVLPLLLELGVPGGRSGVRTGAAARQLAAEVAKYPALQLCGVEFYEGMAKGEDAVRAFVQQSLQTAAALAAAGLLQPATATGKPLLSGAGSAWYDLVAAEFQQAGLADTFALVLRPGCYALHDSGLYQDLQQQVLARSPLACAVPGMLSDALQLWAYVLSRPEPDLVVVGLGKRDAAFDAGLPQVHSWLRPDGPAARPVPVEDGWRSLKIMDQHLLLQVPPTAALAVGDMLSFRTSHPCLTLDKWRQLAVLDDDFVVRRILLTEF